MTTDPDLLQGQMDKLNEDMAALTMTLRRTWESRWEDVQRLPGRVDRLADLVAALREEIEVLNPVAVDWLALLEDEYASELAALTQWVNSVLFRQFPSYTHKPDLAGGHPGPIAPCWQSHTEAIWELGNLWCEWRRIYSVEKPPLGEVNIFFDRWLPDAIRRLTPVMTDCRTKKSGCVLER